MTRLRAAVLALAWGGTLAGCTAIPPVPTTAPPASVPAAITDPAECKRLIAAVDLTKPETIDAARSCRWEAAGTEAAADVLGQTATRDQLWAAVWIYGTQGTDPAPLRPMLQNADPSVRTMAAGALIRLGERAAIDVLQASLSDDDVLAGSKPPVTISAFVVAALGRMIVASGSPAQPTGEPDQTTLASAWRDWLAANASELAYDSDAGGWKLP
jgi:hypothetical protein